VFLYSDRRLVMVRQVKLKGYGVSEATARQIMHLAKQATSQRQCPYRRSYVNWSIWVTTYRNKKLSNDDIYAALLKAGVPCDVTQNSSADYPDLLPQRGTRHTGEQ
jgi:hypothetical protein